MNIPFVDLAAQQARLRDRIDSAITRVLDHGRYILGPEVAELEAMLASHTGSRHCLTYANGTDGLLAALMALEVGPGDAVITSPFTFFATVETIALLGATPVFADIDRATYNLDPSKVAEVIEGLQSSHDLCLKGLATVDLFGLCADYEALLPLACEKGLWVLQDASQAFGAVGGDGKTAPNHGLIGVTSFYPPKPLGCYGDGGAVFTNDDEMRERLASIRIHGQGTSQYDNVRLGLNGRFDTIQAAIVMEKLRIYPEEITLRNRVARGLTERLASTQERVGRGALKLPHVPAGSTSVWAQYTIEVEDRESLRSALAEKGVPTAIYYPTPMHRLKAMEYLGYAEGSFPAAEDAARRVLSLPFGPYLSEDQMDHICASIDAAL